MLPVSLTSVPVVPSLKLWKHKEDSKNILTRARGQLRALPLLYTTGGLEFVRRTDNRLNCLSALEEGRLCLEPGSLSLSQA